MISYKSVKRLHIEPSSFCNAACPNCSRNHFGGPTVPWLKQRNLGLGDFKKFFPEDLISNLELVIFCGSYGDPSLCEDLVEICSWMRSLNENITIQINTNGGTRNAEFWTRLARVLNKRSPVVFSIDGLSDTNHIYRRNVSWEKVMTAITAFTEAGGVADWDFLVFKHNAHQIDEAKRLSQKLGFRNFYVKKAMGFSIHGQTHAMPAIKKDNTFDYYIYPPDNDEQRSGEITRNPVMNAFRPVPVHETQYTEAMQDLRQFSMPRDYEERVSKCKISCYSKNMGELYVSADGELFPCCFIGSKMWMHNQDGFIVNQTQSFMKQDGREAISLHHRSFQEILEGPLFQEKLQKSWDENSMRSGKLAVCAEMCGENFHHHEKRQQV